MNNPNWLDEVKFNDQGLIPVIAQHYQTGRIQMVAWMNQEALVLTAKQQQAIYFSRSRQKLWHKGEESGHFQTVHEIRLDCDGDVIVLQIEQHGGISCHTGRESCFYRKLTAQGWEVVDSPLKDPSLIYHTATHHSTIAQQKHTEEQIDILHYLGELMQQRKQADHHHSYIASLYTKGLNKILEKVGEESIETVIAAKEYDHHRSQEHLNDLIYEVADLWFHSLIMLGHFDLKPTLIMDELSRRQGLSGLVEKANRNQESS